MREAIWQKTNIIHPLIHICRVFDERVFIIMSEKGVHVKSKQVFSQVGANSLAVRMYKVHLMRSSAKGLALTNNSSQNPVTCSQYSLKKA